VAEEQGISFGSCRAILTRDLGMRHLSAKFISQLLPDSRAEGTSDLLECAEADKNLFKNIATGDET
jgi:hypothetical protein